ncbi:MAG: DUF2076 domain-containing protein [Hyphomicrobiaceae bacterium]
MTPEERDLIGGLFERMRGMGFIDKDREAEDFIARSVRQTPDAAYMLVQSVLVQENALQQAGDRIEELEDRVRELERGQPRAAAAQGGGSFLGGLFGGRGQDAQRSSSVPPVGSRREQSRYDEPQGGGSPWGQQRAGAFGQGAPMQQAGGGGGFLKGAMTTAAGVAGGMLLANSISGMMGGKESGKAQAAEASPKAEESSPYEVNQKPEQASHYQDANDNDPGNSGDSSWGDGGGGDLDI